MHSKLLYAYLIVATGTEGAMIYAELHYAFSLFLILAAAQWMIVPLLCQCAKRVGARQVLRYLDGDPALEAERHNPSTYPVFEDHQIAHR